MAKSLTEQLEELQKKVDAITAGRKGADKCRRSLAKAASDYQNEYQKLLDSGLTINMLEAEGIKPVTHVLYELGRSFRKTDEKPDDRIVEEPLEIRQDPAEGNNAATRPEQQPYIEAAMPEQQAGIPGANDQQ